MNLKRKLQLEARLRDVAMLHLWELGIAEISDDMALASVTKLVEWLAPVEDYLLSHTKPSDKE